MLCRQQLIFRCLFKCSVTCQITQIKIFHVSSREVQLSRFKPSIIRIIRSKGKGQCIWASRENLSLISHPSLPHHDQLKQEWNCSSYQPLWPLETISKKNRTKLNMKSVFLHVLLFHVLSKAWNVKKCVLFSHFFHHPFCRHIHCL